jgi:hypothetical protein
MKKQKQKEIKTTEFTQMVSHPKMKEVAPPSEASRNMEGKYSIDRAKAAQAWFKAAKEQEPSKGFLGVPQQDVEAKTAQDREMLYKGKKK